MKFNAEAFDETGNRRDLLLQTLTQGTRASLASMRAAIETIASFPDMDKAARDRRLSAAATPLRLMWQYAPARR